MTVNKHPQKSSALYTALLLRMWRRGEGWQFMVEEIGTGRRCYFDSFAACSTYLDRQLQLAQSADEVRK